MDKRLLDAVEFANYSRTLYNQKKLAKQKFLDACIFYYNAGKFQVDINLITYCIDLKNDSILLDSNQNPIKIEDAKNFLENIKNLYHTALQQYYDEYTEITSSKTVQGIVNV